MTLFAFGPDIVDIPSGIVDLLKPLQAKEFKCDEDLAMNIWRLLNRFAPREFYYYDLDRAHHIGGRGVRYVRKREAAVLTRHAFRSVFGRRHFERVKEVVLRTVLCQAAGLDAPHEVASEELKRGQKFFRKWYREAQKLLPKPAA